MQLREKILSIMIYLYVFFHLVNIKKSLCPPHVFAEQPYPNDKHIVTFIINNSGSNHRCLLNSPN